MVVRSLRLRVSYLKKSLQATRVLHVKMQWYMLCCVLVVPPSLAGALGCFSAVLPRAGVLCLSYGL